MKKSIFPSIPLCLCFWIFVGCDNRTAKEYVCKEFSVECELEKDVVLINPIQWDSSLIDVFARPIKKNEGESFNYYAFSPKIGVLALVTVYTSESCGSECINYDYYPSPKELCEYWGDKARPMSTDLSKLIPGLTQAVVIVSGTSEIVQLDNNRAKILYAKNN